MYRQLDCIALRTVRYSDRNSILTAYTRQAGRQSFLLPAGTGKTASRLRALLMPMGRFECVADIRPGRDIHPIRDVRPIVFPPAGDPLRSTLAMFVADTLAGLLREPMPDPLLFDFVELSLRQLADEGDNALSGNALLNFHICFMVHLTRFLGIEPDWGTYTRGAYLDIADGIFRPLPPPHRHYLPEGESRLACLLGRMTYDNAAHFHLGRFGRNTILDRLLLYYRTHYPSVTEPSSLAILRMMAD